MRGEKVDTRDKVVSLIEPHTDIIVKDRRETLFGHNMYLTGGASNLILDSGIAQGNPADSDMARADARSAKKSLRPLSSQSLF